MHPATLSTYIAFTLYYELSRYNLKYTGGYAQVLGKYYTILHKGLEHPWILVSWDIPKQIPCGAQRTTVLLFHSKGELATIPHL